MSHVIIVGAGPAGASLAYLLTQRGIRVTLLERRKDFAREFRGEILMPSGFRAFEQMGLGPQLAAVQSYTFKTLSVYMNRRDRPIVDLDLDGEPFQSLGAHFVAVSQAALLEMLVAETAQTCPSQSSQSSPLFRLERGTFVNKLLFDGDRVVGVHATTDSGEESIHADLVIGADGRTSTVRKQAGLTATETSPAMDIVWCKLPCPADWPGVRAYLGRGHMLTAYRTWDGTLQLGWVILKGTFGELRSRGIEEWVGEMANQVTPDFAAHLRAHRDSITKPILLNTSADCVDRWSAPGVLVIGDAAHTMSPVGGQGINIALRDTISAANHLVPILSGSAPDPAQLDAALQAIEAERMAEVGPIQSMQAQPPKLILNRSWWGEPARRIAATVIKSPAVRRRAGKRMSVFPFGLTDVHLSV